MTSNPAIFEKAIAGSTDYADALEAAGRGEPCGTPELYEHLAIADIQVAADLLRGVYADSAGRDGYVSFEVSPLLAHDTAGTIAEARRLWAVLGRDNVMIKVPGTPEGTAAIRMLVAEGLNINVTLSLFAAGVRSGGGSVHRRPGVIREARGARLPGCERRKFFREPD